MAIDAKVNFMNQLEQRTGSFLPLEHMNKLLSVIADVLEGFNMQEKVIMRDDTDDLLDSYVSALQVQGRSPKTIERYIYVINRLMDNIKIQTRKVTVYHLRNYLASEKKRGLADSTLEGLRQIYRSYFGWLFRESLIETDPTANLGVIKCPKKKKDIYSETDIEKLYINCKTFRDRVLIHFLASTGCRVSEVTQLNRDEIDYERLECIVHGKGDKERLVYFDAVTGMLLKEYIDERADVNPALFIGQRHERLTPSGVRIMLKNLGEKAGVFHVHPHKFRRTLATNITRRGMPIQTAASILGHEKLDTTMKYVVLNNEDVKTSYRKYA